MDDTSEIISKQVQYENRFEQSNFIGGRTREGLDHLDSCRRNRYQKLKSYIFPISGGMGPLILLLSKENNSSLVNKQISDGIFPDKLLNDRSRKMSFERYRM
ncbi:hypothetical protein GQ457_14G019330 [Hibiscus cannabinus]